jgi:hypothetical protein
MRIRDLLGISPTRQRHLTRAMQAGLAALLVVGLYQRNVAVSVNATVALAITFLPATLERDHEIPMDAGLTLWITAAVFLHTVGSFGFYRAVPGWDHLTHALSSSIVAAAGYATVRAVDEHTDDIYLPLRFTFMFILLFVLAFGVLWEVLEFAADGLARTTGTSSVLAQHGVEDTMKDLIFDAVGAVIVAAWGAAHLTDVVGALTDKLDERRRVNRGR